MTNPRPIGTRFYRLFTPYFSEVPEGPFSTVYTRIEYEVIGYHGPAEIVRTVGVETCEAYFNGTRWLPVGETPDWLAEVLAE